MLVKCWLPTGIWRFLECKAVPFSSPNQQVTRAHGSGLEWDLWPRGRDLSKGSEAKRRDCHLSSNKWIRRQLRNGTFPLANCHYWRDACTLVLCWVKHGKLHWCWCNCYSKTWRIDTKRWRDPSFEISSKREGHFFCSSDWVWEELDLSMVCPCEVGNRW